VALIISSALVVGLFSLAVLLWALASGQYDDPDGDAVRILMDDDADRPMISYGGPDQARLFRR